MSGPAESAGHVAELKPIARLVDKLRAASPPNVPPGEWNLSRARAYLIRIEKLIPTLDGLTGIVKGLDEFKAAAEAFVAAGAVAIDAERQRRAEAAASTDSAEKKGD